MNTPLVSDTWERGSPYERQLASTLAPASADGTLSLRARAWAVRGRTPVELS